MSMRSDEDREELPPKDLNPQDFQSRPEPPADLIPPDRDTLRARIIGFGERSYQKSYYPELQKRLTELERFRTLLDQSSDAIFLMLVASDRMQDVNETACRLLGYSRAELLERVMPDLVLSAVDQVEILAHTPLPAPSEGKTIITELRRKDGSTFPVEMTARQVSFGEELYAVFVARDISQRVQAEKVQSATYRISELVHTTPTLFDLYASIHAVIGELMPAANFYIAIYDEAADLISFPYYADAFDSEAEPIHPGKSMTGYVLKTGKPLLAHPPVFDALIEKGEVELVGTRPVDWLGVPLRGKNGHTAGVIAVQTYSEGIRLGEAEKEILTFVSTQAAMAIEYKRVEEALRSSEQLYRSLVNVLPDGVALSDLQGNINFVSPRLRAMFGNQVPGTAIGSHLGQWMTPESYDRARAHIAAILRHEEPVNNEYLLLRKDGSAFYGEINGALIPDEQGQPKGLVTVTRDISDRKRAEQELRRHAARAEALVRIAGQLNAQLDLDSLLKMICQEAASAISASAAWILLYDPQLEIFQCSSVVGLPEGFCQAHQPVPRTHYPNPYRRTGDGFYQVDIQNADSLWNRDLFRSHHVRTIASVMMARDEQLVGTLAVATLEDERTFREDELILLRGIADQAAQAILNVQLFTNVQRHLKYEQALHDIDLMITGSTELQDCMDLIISQVRTQLGVDAASILLLDPHSQQLTTAAGSGFKSPYFRLNQKVPGDSHAGQAVMHRSMVSVRLPAGKLEDFEQGKHLFSAEGFVCYYASPLVAKDRVHGVLEIFHRSMLTPEREWLDFFNTLTTQAAIAIDNKTMLHNLEQKNRELEEAYDATLQGLSRALSLRDEDTEEHTRRVRDITMRLAKRMGIDEAQMVHISRGSLLHDIGKIFVPDDILKKDGPLSPEEWVIMRRHPKSAHDMLWPIAYLRPAMVIPYYHHERWDGTGYPEGLKGEEIPLAARLFAVVDVWDALRTDRPYRKALSREKALEYLHQQSGKHFDPRCVEQFLALEPSLIADYEPHPQAHELQSRWLRRAAFWD